MVRPPKPKEIKQTIPVRQSNTKTLKPTKSDLEDPLEASIRKKSILDTLKRPTTSFGKTGQNKSKSISQKTKISPKTSKATKTQAETPSGVSQISTNPSQTIKTKKSVRRGPILKKKNPPKVQSDPTNRLLKITEVEETDRTSLPSEDQIAASELKGDSKLKSKKKGTKKGSKKVAKQDSPKNIDFSLKTEESGASLTTHFRIPFLSNDIPPISNTDSKYSSLKKRKPSLTQKKGSKPKTDEEDKEIKNTGKSKLHNSKFVNRVLSSDSVVVFPVQEFKHNDSFVISARKLQKSTRDGNCENKPDCLKLYKTSSVPRTKNDNLSLKSCLKKTINRDSIIYKIG